MSRVINTINKNFRIILAIIVVVLFAACDSSIVSSQGSLSINIGDAKQILNYGGDGVCTSFEDDSDSKTIQPESMDSIVMYVIDGAHGNNSNTFSVEFNAGDDIVIDNLLVGLWEISARGYNARGELIATSNVVTVEIERDQISNATLQMDYIFTGTGTFSCICSIKAENVAKYLTIEFFNTKTGETTETSKTVKSGAYTFNVNKESGNYIVKLSVKASDSSLIGDYYSDSLYIYNGKTSTLTLNWHDGVFFKTEKPIMTKSGSDSSVAYKGESVTITAADDSLIYYTTDGSEPFVGSNFYTDPIVLDRSMTIKAFAFTDYNSIVSDIVSQTYDVHIKNLSINVNNGTYDYYPEVTITTPTDGAVIKYTTDGTEPSEENGLIYDAPILLMSTTNLKAIAIADGCIPTDVLSRNYTIYIAPPTISVESGDYDALFDVELSSQSKDVTIKYTLDGSDPSLTNGFVYTEPLSIEDTTTLKAITIKNSCNFISDIATRTYTFNEVKTDIAISKEDDFRMSIMLPDEFINEDTIYQNQCYTVSAVLTPTQNNVSYKWYVDGELVSKNRDLIFGKDYIIGSDKFNVTVKAIAGGISLTETISITVTPETLPALYSIGDIGPNNGYIFYDIDADNTLQDPDGEDNLVSSACGWRYLEAEQTDLLKSDGTKAKYMFGLKMGNRDGDATWMFYVNGSRIYNSSNCTRDGIGEGDRNTRLLKSAMSSGALSHQNQTYLNLTKVFAANQCDDGWYIPSTAELLLMYENLKTADIGDFEQNGYYWTSCESSSGYDALYAYNVSMYAGTVYDTHRGTQYYIRRIRQVQ